MAAYTVEDKHGKIHDGITADEAIKINMERNPGFGLSDYSVREGVIYCQDMWLYKPTDNFYPSK